ncbi:permease prefix domain 1-containing protein [Homoserinimonas sp. OAct 916]|uniref:permease prefix domain 1-containing protein n=1 Tax=Homoserinimonas sp. OAct 916 TaxID=2211450 RepID=UPI000DBE626F|nr:permease prefix domain 1-containing protein [Homoserinimonas sp. OAct 916]
MDAVETVIEDYVVALGRALHGPSRVRRGLVAEARDHLIDATEAYECVGLDRRSAAEQAVREFGPVIQVAPTYQAVLAVAAARRCAVTLLALLLPQAFLWDKGLLLAPLPGNDAQWLSAVLHTTIEWLGFSALIIAFVAVAISGIGQRWLSVGQRFARWTGISVACGAIGSAVVGVTLLILDNDGSATAWILVSVLMVLPMAWTANTARLCLHAA